MSLKCYILTKESKQQILQEVQAGESVVQAACRPDLHPNLIGRWQKLHEQYAKNALQGKAAPTPRKPRSPRWSG